MYRIGGVANSCLKSFGLLQRCINYMPSKKMVDVDGVGKTGKSMKAGTVKKDNEKKPKAMRVAKPVPLYAEWAKAAEVPWPKKDRQPMPADGKKILTWNVAGLRAWINNRSEQLRNVIDEEKPDVICMQETKLQREHENEWGSKVLEIAGPNYAIAFQSCVDENKKGYSGTAMLYRKGFLKKVDTEVSVNEFWKTTNPGKKENEGRLMVGEAATFVVLNMYVMNSGRNLERLDERVQKWDICFREFVKMLEKEYRKPVVVAADMNVAHLAEDIWNLGISPHIAKQAGCTDEERDSMTKTLIETGLVDAFRLPPPIGVGASTLAWFTFWATISKNKLKNRGLRLDYTLVSSKLAQKVADTFVLKDYSQSPFGDHCPAGIVVRE